MPGALVSVTEMWGLMGSSRARAPWEVLGIISLRDALEGIKAFLCSF